MRATRSRSPPPPKFDFDRALRADGRLNITYRTLRLMAALSERTGYASMSIDRMAAELAAEPAALRQARQKIVRMGYFRAVGRWRYRRAGAEDESKRDFWLRIRRDRRLDLATRVAFFLSEETAETGQAEVSLAEIAEALGADRGHVARALRGLLRRELFGVARGGRANTYTRTVDIYDATESEHDDADEEPEDPYSYLDRRSRARRRKPARAAG